MNKTIHILAALALCLSLSACAGADGVLSPLCANPKTKARSDRFALFFILPAASAPRRAGGNGFCGIPAGPRRAFFRVPWTARCGRG